VISDLRAAARALGGEVVSHAEILCPGPGHNPRDRSLSVKIRASLPDGFMTHSFADDDWRDCRDHVRRVLRIERQRQPALCGATEASRPPELRPRNGDGRARALALWHAAVDPRGTLAERYLRSRQLEIGDDIAGRVLRWHPAIGTMIALFRSVVTDEPQAISRTFLDRDGQKLGRKFLGPVGGAAIKIDSDENVLAGLHIGEGIETCMAARLVGLRPTWALGSAGEIGNFPVVKGIECLTILAEHDDANKTARQLCGERWDAAGREVLINYSVVGKDLNDAIRSGS
jgi:putative DNA primase/helicase